MRVSPRSVAMITGASRGIGKAAAVALAEAGYDVALTARTLHSGDESARAPETGDLLPGSLDETASFTRAAGAASLCVHMDLLDRDSVAAAVDSVVDRFGRIDVLVNNAIFVGPGNQSRFFENDPANIEHRLYGNLTAQLLLIHRAGAAMLRTGGGTIVNITSAAGYSPVRKRPDQGGWSLAYGVSKAGFTRVAEQLAVEYGGEGLRAYSLNPGFVATERVRAAGAALGFVADAGVEPSVIGGVIAWVVTHGVHELANGARLEGPEIAGRLGLL